MTVSLQCTAREDWLPPLLNIGSISPACTSLDSNLCGSLHCPASTGLANVKPQSVGQQRRVSMSISTARAQRIRPSPEYIRKSLI